MDVHTEQTYQQHISELELQNASLETRVAKLTHQLAQRNAQMTQRDAIILELRVQLT
jgi:hypothetical protein